MISPVVAEKTARAISGTNSFETVSSRGPIVRSKSACNLCGCGCAITLERSENKVAQIRPAENHYSCAKRQTGWNVAHHPARLTTPMVRIGGTLVRCTWEEALSVIAASLNVIKKERGPRSIGCLGSVWTTNEDNYIFQKFARTVIGTNNVDLLSRREDTAGLNSFLSGDLSKLKEHDVILVLDKDAGEINPLTCVEIAHAVNREGKRLIVVSDEPNKLTRIATVVVRSLSRETAVTGLAKAVERPAGEWRAEMSQAARLLRAAESVAIVVPSNPSPGEDKVIRELAGRLKNFTYYPLMNGGNLQGGLDMGVMPDHYPGYQKVGPRTRARFGKAWNAILPETAGMSAIEMIRAVESRKIAALYIMGDDPVRSDPDLGTLFEKLDFLVVQDILLTETARIADAVLPAVSFVEKTGTFTNLERRLRLLTKAAEFVGEAMPDWKIIQAVANRMGAAMNYTSAVEIMKEIKSTVPMYKDLAIDACWPGEQVFPEPERADSGLSRAPDSIIARETLAVGRPLRQSDAAARDSEGPEQNLCKIDI